MAQDVDQEPQELDGEPQEPQDPEDRDEATRYGVWPWILLAIVVLIVILLLWLYWRQGQGASVSVIKKSSEISIVIPEPRPEPIVPEASGVSAETSTVPTVPNVLGSPKSSAVRALEAAGYAVSASQVYRASKASGLVVEQSPGGGEALERGRTVSIVVAVSSPTNEVAMPKVVDLTESAAKQKVEAAGLVPRILYGDVRRPAGRVISQWPLPGDTLTAGSEGFIQVQLSP